jgi:hypothetical protein
MSNLKTAVTLAAVMEVEHGRGAVIEKSLLFIPAEEVIKYYSDEVDGETLKLVEELLNKYDPDKWALIIQDDLVIEPIELSMEDRATRHQTQLAFKGKKNKNK